VGGGQRKADDDYAKRTEGPDGLPMRDVTYVQVILAVWQKARTWSAQRTKERRWKEVRAYNLDRVHAWLDSAPATTAWLAEKIGKAMPGVHAAGNWWTETWLPSTNVPLDTGIVLAGRESAAAELLSRLTTGERVTALGGDLRPEEARAFIAGCLEMPGASVSAGLAARTLFVSDSGSLSQIIRQPEPLVLVLTDPALATDLPGEHAHQLILLALPGSVGDVQIPPVSGPVVTSQLEAAGLPRDEAWSLGTPCVERWR
jgi:hypothetical protein